MSDPSSRIRAATPAVFVAGAAIVAIALTAGNVVVTASNERTINRRVEIAKSEADKALADLKIAESRNGTLHALSLIDRTNTKAVVGVNHETIEHNAGRIDALEKAIGALRAELAKVKGGSR